MSNSLVTFLVASITLGTPLVLAALGGYLSERGGLINIALEGNMIMATIFGAWAAAATGSPWIGFAAAILASVLLSLGHYVLTQVYKVEQVISGMACNLLAAGIANVADRITSISGGTRIATFPVWVFVGLAILLPFVLATISRRTSFGIRLMASGGDPDKARQMGVSPLKIRLIALIGTGILCGLAGCFMLANVGYYTEGMTAGRGFIALAALILGTWRPIPTFVACLAFGAFEALQIQMQGVPIFGIMLPRELWLSLPYMVTVVAMAGFLSKGRAPAGLGKV